MGDGLAIALKGAIQLALCGTDQRIEVRLVIGHTLEVDASLQGAVNGVA